MKKILVFLAAAALFTSCEDVTKCKCTFKAGPITIEDQIIAKPDDVKCSEITIQDIDGEIIDIDLSKIGTITCVNYYD